MDLGLKDKVAIVTGSSKGLGKAIALELAREGCWLVLCARGEQDLNEAVEDVRRIDGAGEYLAVPADVTEGAEVKNLVDQTVDRFGTVDILVNNVGRTGRRSPFHELSDDE